VGQTGAGDPTDKSPARHATGGRIRSESHRITDTDPRGPPPRSTATTLTDLPVGPRAAPAAGSDVRNQGRRAARPAIQPHALGSTHPVGHAMPDAGQGRFVEVRLIASSAPAATCRRRLARCAGVENSTCQPSSTATAATTPGFAQRPLHEGRLLDQHVSRLRDLLLHRGRRVRDRLLTGCCTPGAFSATTARARSTHAALRKGPSRCRPSRPGHFVNPEQQPALNPARCKASAGLDRS
jgi:hypothetical protein